METKGGFLISRIQQMGTRIFDRMENIGLVVLEKLTPRIVAIG